MADTVIHDNTPPRHLWRSYLRINSDRAFRGSGAEDGEGTLTLDPVSASLVGKLLVASLLNTVEKKRGPAWHGILKEVFDIINPGNWCGRKACAAVTPVQVTRPIFKRAVAQLETGGVLVSVDKRHALGNAAGRDYVTIFLVPKDDHKSRAIGNCRSLNERFAKGPRLSFASMEDLFRIITFFDKQTYFATADFRHWFYQIPLPKEARRFFTVQCEEKLCQFTVWPMGFSWSPFVAQGLSMLIAWLAIQSQKNVTAIPPSTSDADIPPFWLIAKKGTVGRPNKTDIKGFIVFWYDNLLLVTDSPVLRDNLRKSLASTAEDYHAMWKSAQSTETFKEEEAFISTQDQVTYLGIHFKRSQRKWTWQHVEKNLTKWGSKTEAIPNEQGEFTWKDLAFLSGVLTWDWTVSGRGREALGIALRIALKIGSHRIADHEWKEKVTDIDKWKPILEEAKRKIRAVLSGGPQRRELENVTPFRNKVFLASDACDTSGAWVNLDTHETQVENFSAYDRQQHINWKETLWALRALEAEIGKCRDSTLVKIGVDNMTAVCALQHRVVGFDRRLDTMMQAVLESFKAKGCLWVAHHIAGDMQPADEPSRHQKLDEGKIRSAKLFLEGKADEWHHWVEEKREEKVGSKRSRPIEE